MCLRAPPLLAPRVLAQDAGERLHVEVASAGMRVELGEARVPGKQAVGARLPGEHDAQLRLRGLEPESLAQHVADLLRQRFALLLK